MAVVVKLDIPKLTKEVLKACDDAAEKAVTKVEADAKRFIANRAKHPTGKLASEIKLEKSKFEGGGWAVEAQGPGNYTKFYATFVELGSIKNPQPIPYLRTPLKRNRSYIKNLFKDII